MRQRKRRVLAASTTVQHCLDRRGPVRSARRAWTQRAHGHASVLAWHALVRVRGIRPCRVRPPATFAGALPAGLPRLVVAVFVARRRLLLRRAAVAEGVEGRRAPPARLARALGWEREGPCHWGVVVAVVVVVVFVPAAQALAEKSAGQPGAEAVAVLLLAARAFAVAHDRPALKLVLPLARPKLFHEVDVLRQVVAASAIAAVAEQAARKADAVALEAPAFEKWARGKNQECQRRTRRDTR